MNWDFVALGTGGLLSGGLAGVSLLWASAKLRVYNTFLPPGEIITIARGETPYRQLLWLPGFHLNDPQDLNYDPTWPDWEVLPNKWQSRKLSGQAAIPAVPTQAELQPATTQPVHVAGSVVMNPLTDAEKAEGWHIWHDNRNWMEQTLGIYFTGGWPLQSVMSFDQEWSEERVSRVDNGVLVDIPEGELWVRREKVRTAYAKAFTYFRIINCRTSDGVQITVRYYFTARTTNGFKAWFFFDDWFDLVAGVTDEVVRNHFGAKDWRDVQSETENRPPIKVKKAANAQGKPGQKRVKLKKDVEKRLSEEILLLNRVVPARVRPTTRGRTNRPITLPQEQWYEGLPGIVGVTIDSASIKDVTSTDKSIEMAITTRFRDREEGIGRHERAKGVAQAVREVGLARAEVRQKMNDALPDDVELAKKVVMSEAIQNTSIHNLGGTAVDLILGDGGFALRNQGQGGQQQNQGGQGNPGQQGNQQRGGGQGRRGPRPQQGGGQQQQQPPAGGAQQPPPGGQPPP